MIIPVTSFTTIPDDATCQEAGLGSVHFYIPCGKRAVAIIGYNGRTEGPYYMCGPCANHNVRNRGGKLIYIKPGEERWVAR